MTRRADGPTLAERARAGFTPAERTRAGSTPAGRTRAGRAGSTPAELTRAGRAGPEAARHCWVVDSPGHPGRYPGLLVEWRRTAAGWQGRVVYALPEPDGGTRLTERWVAAEHLEPC